MDQVSQLRVGIDCVSKDRFSRLAAHGDFRGQVFRTDERVADDRQEASTYALKEAAMKALDLPAGSWQQLRVKRSNAGRPLIEVLGEGGSVLDASISHEGDFTVAVVLAQKTTT